VSQTDQPNWVQFMPVVGLNRAQNALAVAIEPNWVQFMPVVGLNRAQNAVAVAP
jgi:hypothetical protein